MIGIGEARNRESTVRNKVEIMRVFTNYSILHLKREKGPYLNNCL